MNYEYFFRMGSRGQCLIIPPQLVQSKGCNIFDLGESVIRQYTSMLKNLIQPLG